MSFLIELNESSAGRRTVPFRLFNSDGTSPATGASNATMLGSLNGAAQLSLGSLSAVSANAGLYSFALSQSNVSVLGSWALYTDAVGLNFSQHVATVQVVNNNPFSSQSNVVKVTLTPGDYSGATVGINNAAGDVSSRWTVAVGAIKAQSYSGVTIQGVSNTSAAKDIVSDITTGVWYAGVRSGVTVEVNNAAGDVSSRWTVAVGAIKAASYSGVTIQGVSNTANFPGGTSNASSPAQIADYVWASYLTRTLTGTSTATIQGVTRVNSSVTIANADYSAVTVRVSPQDYSGLTVGVGRIAGGTYSDVSLSVRAGGMASSSFQAAAIDAAAIATDADAEIADAILGRNVAGGSSTGRTVSEALYAIRNRVAISGSTGTVYQTDDTTSAWTFSVTTVSAVGISDLNPAG